MVISKKVSDILWAMAERYLASLPEDERNQILSCAEKTRTPSSSKQVKDSTNS
ncbi:hypothetical protein NIES4101_66150 [Calothrix sp. NIES-4101]|nr:hypothetical protein NIES4101_66150 [Calothrix sp. NIES-4101]